MHYFQSPQLQYLTGSRKCFQLWNSWWEPTASSHILQWQKQEVCCKLLFLSTSDHSSLSLFIGAGSNLFTSNSRLAGIGIKWIFVNKSQKDSAPVEQAKRCGLNASWRWTEEMVSRPQLSLAISIRLHLPHGLSVAQSVNKTRKRETTGENTEISQRNTSSASLILALGVRRCNPAAIFLWFVEWKMHMCSNSCTVRGSIRNTVEHL